ncbi:MAG TPA: hypothetical protein VK509_25695 [Polyangiales bacterium]|nr:hypothetical protein [Polyangiales bacterium]
MKHAGSDALDAIEDLLVSLRQRSALRERKRGIFYLQSRSFLHFHEDPAGIFADVSHAGDMVRLRVQIQRERKTLLAHVDAILGPLEPIDRSG